MFFLLVLVVVSYGYLVHSSYEKRLGTLRESMCLSTRIESILVEEMEVFVIY